MKTENRTVTALLVEETRAHQCHFKSQTVKIYLPYIENKIYFTKHDRKINL